MDPPFHASLHRAISKCGSQLEMRLALAFLASPGVFSFQPDGEHWVDTSGVELRQQVTIAGYKADFTLGGELAIEVDGSAWHDAPKAVERDRRRDRALLAVGFRVVRFSELEVTTDALACAREAYALARETVRPKQIAWGFRKS